MIFRDSEQQHADRRLLLPPLQAKEHVEMAIPLPATKETAFFTNQGLHIVGTQTARGRSGRVKRTLRFMLPQKQQQQPGYNNEDSRCSPPTHTTCTSIPYSLVQFLSIERTSNRVDTPKTRQWIRLKIWIRRNNSSSHSGGGSNRDSDNSSRGKNCHTLELDPSNLGTVQRFLNEKLEQS